ncbi:MAG: tetratricopeptide repeat protein [Verrucomicrobiae bacterium]|nr:tetratricopeptide repeat protein [Verrucomicrobiae bacterium]
MVRRRWLPLSGLLVTLLLLTGCQTTRDGRGGKSPSGDAPGTESDAVLEQRVKAHAAYAAGVLLQEREEPEAAFAQFVRATEFDPSNEPLATEVAGFYLQRNQFPEALAVLQRTAAQPGTSGVSKTLLAVTLRRVGRTNEAMAAFADAIRSTPTLLAPYQELAELHLAEGQTNRAVALVESSLQVSSEVPAHWLATGDLFAWLAARSPDARERAVLGRRQALDRATALGTTDPALLLRLGRAWMDLGDATAAEAMFQQAARQLPRDPAVAANLAELMIRDGRLKEARESLELLSRFNPTSHFPWYFLAILDLDERNVDEAVRKFERAIAVNPDFEPAYADLAAVQMNRGQTETALDLLKRARVRFPESHRVVLLLGVAETRVPDVEAALQAFAEAEALALKTEPPDHRFYFQAGAALERAGATPEAIRYLRRALEVDPDFDEAQNHLGYLWAERGENLDEALQLIERAVAADPENPAYLDSLGWVLFKLERPAEALPWMEKAVQFLPEPDATVYDHLGDVLEALGRPDEARAAWEKSLGVEASDDVRKKLERP